MKHSISNHLHIGFSPILALFFICLGVTALSGGAVAEPPKAKTLIELYTSQGCNSCPPANKLLKNYVNREDVIAISLPVDYWDYLGWKDTYGKSQFSNRQRRYARVRRDGQVYTPQIVANGLEHAVGSRPHAINNAIRKSRSAIQNKQIPLELKMKDGTLTLRSMQSDGASPGAIATGNPGTIVWLALTKKIAATQVPRGENRGKTVTYYNVVRELKQVGSWTGEPMQIKLPKNHDMNSGKTGCVVFLQLGRGGPVIGAAEL